MSYGRTNIWFESIRSDHASKAKEQYVTTNLKNENVVFWTEMLKILDTIFSSKVQEQIEEKWWFSQ